jgi:hypothetical protein
VWPWADLTSDDFNLFFKYLKPKATACSLHYSDCQSHLKSVESLIWIEFVKKKPLKGKKHQRSILATQSRYTTRTWNEKYRGNIFIFILWHTDIAIQEHQFARLIWEEYFQDIYYWNILECIEIWIFFALLEGSHTKQTRSQILPRKLIQFFVNL